jgi:hypothetical protein
MPHVPYLNKTEMSYQGKDYMENKRFRQDSRQEEGRIAAEGSGFLNKKGPT